MLNSTIDTQNDEILTLKTLVKSKATYNHLPISWITQDIYNTLQNAKTNQEILEKFDWIPQDRLTNLLKNYYLTIEQGLFSSLYSEVGISIKDLKPRILRAINLVSFRDKEKRLIWKLYEQFNDYDDFIIEHNAELIKQIDCLLTSII